MAKEIIEELKETTEEKIEETPVADLFLGTILMAVSVVAIIIALSWPKQINPASAPYIFPIFIAGTLFLMALSIFLSALKQKGHLSLIEDLKRDHVKKFLMDKETRLGIFAVSTVLIYMIVILNFVSFEIGTFVYMVGSLYFFWRAKLYKIIIISAIVTAFYYVAFKYFFGIMLPGRGM